MGGGGTDLASFYRSEGGYWTSAAISLYVRITVNLRWSPHWVVKYSDMVQRVDKIEDIGHGIIRESLLLLKANEWLKDDDGNPLGLETNIISDVPSKSGLGVSGAIAVSLLQIL